MDFHDLRFPAHLSAGSTGGPERRTEIVTLSNGFEERNTAWKDSRRRYDAGIGLRSMDDLHAVLSFFEARSGRLHAFRWKDFLDFKSCAPSATPGATDQVLATADGSVTEFYLTRKYGSSGYEYVRRILKPVVGTVLVAVNGAPRTEGADYTVDHGEGRISFTTPPAAGGVVSAGFEFDVPVRFDTDRIEVNMASFASGEIPSIPIVEVRL